MPTLTYQDLKYKREDRYYNLIKPIYDELSEENPSFTNFLAKDIADFYHLLSTAIRIDNHPNIQIIKRAIKAKYEVDTTIRVFQYENVLPKAMCSLRKYYDNKEPKSDLLILVSQHYFNNLDFQEQIAIISHELCHLILGHIHIPANQLIHGSFDYGKKYRDLRLNLLKWSLCAEISSDIFALYSSDFNPKVFSSAIIKFASGVHALDSYDFISILLNQYHDLAESVSNADLTPHPILPLRIKVIDEVCKCELVKRMGEEVSDEEYQRLISEYNHLIDEIVFKVNPELFDERRREDHDLYLLVGTAVILSDNQITEEEISLISNLTSASHDINEYFIQIQNKVRSSSFEDVVDELLEQAVEYCETNNFTYSEIIPVVRFMLHVAASDNVALEELNTIYRFASNYDITKEEIIVLMHQTS